MIMSTIGKSRPLMTVGTGSPIIAVNIGIIPVFDARFILGELKGQTMYSLFRLGKKTKS